MTRKCQVRFGGRLMEKRSGGSFRFLRTYHNGRKYGAAVVRYPNDDVCHISFVQDLENFDCLPIHEIEKEYAKEIKSAERMTIRSWWAARRRLKQYLRVWDKIQKEELQ